MYDHGMVGPVIGLVAWTLVVWIWMFATRIPAMQAAKIDLTTEEARRAGSLKGKLPRRVEQVADNYAHLHEQPTIFYALALAMQAGGMADPVNIGLAWAYMVSRVLHSLVQNTVNVIMVRFAVFLAGSLVLIAMTVRALMAMLG